MSFSLSNPKCLDAKKRNWQVVQNNPGSTDYTAAAKLFDTGIVQYIIVAQENFNMPDKTPHLHIFIQFKNCSRRGHYVKKFWPKAHIEWCVGTADQNRNYALGIGKTAEEHGKPMALDEDITEYGKFQPNCQGRKFAGVKRALDNGATLGDISQNHFGLYVRYHKSFKRYKQDNIKRRTWKTEVFVLYGSSGTGKSRFYWDRYPNGCALEYRNNFWSDYNGEEAVLMDDFNPNMISRELFLKLTDRYPMKIRQIGGWSEWSPKVIYITTNHDPEYWYGNHEDCVHRRITEIINFDESGVSKTSITPAHFVPSFSLNYEGAVGD